MLSAFRYVLVPLVLTILAPLVMAQQDDQAPRRYQRAFLIRFEGPITPLLEQYFYRKLNVARQRNADLIILEIDSPGGFTITSINIAERLRDTDWARTVAFIPRDAISGAAVVSLGCDEIVMAKRARLGDVGEIMMGADNAYRYVPEKERSVLVRQVRDLANAKGRSPAIAEAMVDMDLVVYEVRNEATGETAFMSEGELDAAEDGQWTKVSPVLESREKHFLTLNGERAVELKIAAGIAEDRDDLQKRYRLTGELVILEPTAVDTAVTILNFPVVTGLLFVIGLIALYIEFSAPGIGVGGGIAGLCFAVFFWSRFLGGTSGWLEVILFAAGVIFIAMEFFVIPGFGIAGISGVLLMLVSVLMASQHFLVPSNALELNTTLNSLTVVVGSGIVFFVTSLALSRYFGSIPLLNRLVLDTPAPVASDSEMDEKQPATAEVYRFPVQQGDWGVADSPLRPAGKAWFGESFVDVVTDGAFVEKGRQVRIIEISGNRVVVREIEETS